MMNDMPNQNEESVGFNSHFLDSNFGVCQQISRHGWSESLL